MIPVILEILHHGFKIFTLVSELHGNVHLVLDIKKIPESEGIINLRESCFNFLKKPI